MKGYKRADGKVGIRNHVAVMYTVECAHHVADKIAASLPEAQVFGFPGCYPDAYGSRMLAELGKHPNVAAVVVVRIGCECFPIDWLLNEIRSTGKRVELIDIQRTGGTIPSIALGCRYVREMAADARQSPLTNIDVRDLIIGVECGGSDATSGLAANPATGWAMDRIIAQGGTAIFSELPELLGSDAYLVERGITPNVQDQIRDGLQRARKLCNLVHAFAVSVGNHEGGLTTIEEKSLGALCKGGTQPITGVLKTGQRPDRPGLYLLDKIGSLDTNQLAYYEESDNDGLITLIASGAHLLIFTTGRGNVIGSVIDPVVKVCGNPETARRMAGDMDVDAGGIVDGIRTLDEVGQEIYERILRVAGGEPTKAEQLGHQEYHIPYKPGRACDCEAK